MTAPTVVRTNPNGVVNRVQVVFSGTYTAESDEYDDDGVVLDGSGNFTIDVGFEPLHVKVVNVTDRITQEWYKGMNSGDFLETVAAGDMTLETDDQLIVAVAETGSAPVTVKPTYLVTVNAGGTAMGDNDTVVVIIEG